MAATTISASEIFLTWDKVNGSAFVNYTVSWNPGEGNVTTANLSINIIGLESNTEYSFILITVNEAGKSAESIAETSFTCKHFS